MPTLRGPLAARFGFCFRLAYQSTRRLGITRIALARDPLADIYVSSEVRHLEPGFVPALFVGFLGMRFRLVRNLPKPYAEIPCKKKSSVRRILRFQLGMQIR